jgi:uncharacterized protein (TIGR00288 family)
MSEIQNPKKIALLIDCDNISFRVIETVISELQSYGDVIIKRAYGNWRKEGLENWVTKLTELSIKPIHQIDYTKGKNATDMAIIIDAMDLMHLKKADAFAIVSSDSDFTPLIMKLQEEGYKVYGFGYESAPISLKNSCSVFTDVTHFAPKKIKETPKDKEKINQEAKEQSEFKKTLSQKVIDVFVSFSPDNKPITLESFNKELKLQDIDFKILGFSQFKVFLDNLNIFNIHINDKNQGFATLKQINQEQSPIVTDINLDLLLMTQVKECYNNLSHNNEAVLTSSLYNLLGLKYQFKYKNYGFPTFRAFVEKITFFTVEKNKGQWYVQFI